MAKQKKHKILIVCTGNTCRSPMAKVILEKLLEDNDLKDQVLVSSAGIISLGGAPASKMAVEVCRDNGLDLSTHQSKRLTDSIIRDADLIIVMEQMHKELILKTNSADINKIKLLSEFVQDGSMVLDIEDPYGGNRDQYEHAYIDIELCLKGLVSELSGKPPA
ncbi:low molecular weight protein arginine phosphatase [Gemmatimonadota bacterium]